VLFWSSLFRRMGYYNWIQGGAVRNNMDAARTIFFMLGICCQMSKKGKIPCMHSSTSRRLSFGQRIITVAPYIYLHALELCVACLLWTTTSIMCVAASTRLKYGPCRAVKTSSSLLESRTCPVWLIWTRIGPITCAALLLYEARTWAYVQ
jgi:hypothetical protein